ncbi:carboxypeptidase M32 [Balneatrix alpica]|uniref:carboxypeptidase M32 n=1 Tax=Balneatrix alpica TaxID=75684 RepID=UPI00273841D4|nr:carboxypeptidase M32 [Balneatrix alpica]
MSANAANQSSLMAYQELQNLFQRLAHYRHLLALGHWDQAAMMPDGGMQARADAIAELSSLCHAQLCQPQVKDWLAAAEQAELDAWQRANLNEMRRQWQQANLLPAELVKAKSLAGARCEHGWRQQRKQNDWQGFAANLKEVVALSRQEAAIRAEHLGCRRYDALLELYEPGIDCATLDSLFGQMKSWLPGLIQQVLAKQAQEPVIPPQGPFAIAQQRELGLAAMAKLGFDFNHGRLDVSAHPFCGGVPSDVRITTRYSEDDFTQSLMGVIHETGHARYEQGLPKAWAYQPVGEARSMGVHESQSLFFEMQLGRHPAMLEQLQPLMVQAFPQQPALALDNLIRFYTRVQPGFIRVDADEVTYPCHIILRYELEKALIEGEIEVEDIPALWDEKMQAYLGIRTLGNDRQGCMQDIHWTDGSFGYFPSYTLGAIYAAQQAAAVERQLGSLDELIRQQRLGEVFAWLEQHIWSQGCRYSTPELLQRATGESLNASYLEQHLRRRYL